MKCRKYCDFLHLQNGTSVWDSKIHKFSDFILNYRPLNIENTLISSFYKTEPQLRTLKNTNFQIFILNSRPLKVENTLTSSIYKTGLNFITQKTPIFRFLFYILDH